MADRIRRSTFSVLALALGALLSAGVASAQDFEDPVSIAWKFGYGLSDSTYHAAWEEYKRPGIPRHSSRDRSDRSELRGHWWDVALFAGHGREQGRTRLDLEPQPHERTVRHELCAEQGEVQADRHRRHRSGRRSDSNIRIDVANGTTIVALTNTNPPSTETSALTQQLLAIAQANP